MKDIILIRTSTLRQEVEEQLKEIIEYRNGYSNNEYIIIGGKGASAINLDEQYMFNMNQVFSLIEKGGIECIYAWSIDRIGRNEELLMRFKNKLIEKKVQLRIKNPSLYLLNDDGTVNSGMEIAFSLFATMSKQEMEIKKERFKRSKKRNKELGRYNGGKVKFGYAVDAGGYFIPSETNAPYVKEIFDTYAFSPVSIKWISRKMAERGIFNNNERVVESLITRMLKDEGYIGKTYYPRLVDDATFYAVQDKLKEFRIQPKVKYEVTPYYCQGLLYDIADDNQTHRMRVKKSETSYVSYTEKFSLNINFFDSMVIQILDIVFSKLNVDAVNKVILDRISVNRNRIAAIETELSKLMEKDAELDEKYFLGKIRNYDDLKKKLEIKINSFKNEIDTLSSECVSMEKDKVNLDVDIYALNDEQRRELILKYVDVIYARKMNKWESHINIELLRRLNISVSVVYDRKSKSFRFYYEPYWNKINIVRNIKGRIRKSSC